MTGWESAETSPFIFDGPVPPEQVVGRDQELAVLRDRAAHGRFSLLYAPRRYGKTSVLGRLRADAAATDRTPMILVDLFGIVSHADLAVRLERAYARHASGRVRAAIERTFRQVDLGLSLGGSGISVRLARDTHADPLHALHALLDVPVQLAQRWDGRVVIVFDEFQAVGAISGMDGLIRSHIQHHRDHASYLFAGSERGALAALFDDERRPLYRPSASGSGDWRRVRWVTPSRQVSRSPGDRRVSS